MLRNILGPVFNVYLDQLLTYKFFFVFETPFYSVFSKHAKFKETQKKKKDTICEHNCANCSCQSVRFSAFLIFAVFSISVFIEDVLFGFPKSKIQKKQSKQTKKQEQKEDKRCKAKTNEIL